MNLNNLKKLEKISLVLGFICYFIALIIEITIEIFSKNSLPTIFFEDLISIFLITSLLAMVGAIFFSIDEQIKGMKERKSQVTSVDIKETISNSAKLKNELMFTNESKEKELNK